MATQKLAVVVEESKAQ